MSLNLETTKTELLKQIESGSVQLKETDTVDKSAPVTAGATVGKSDRDSLLKKVESGTDLKKVDDSSDRSAPQLEAVHVQSFPRQTQLLEIEEGVQLKPTDTVDKTAPKLPVGAPRQEAVSEVLHEVEKPHQLKHTEGGADRSAPVISKDVHVKKFDKDPLLKDVQKGAELKHTDQVSDRSAPKIEENVQVKKGDRAGFLKEVEGQKGGENLNRTAWENMQLKTFTNWMNSHLRKSGHPKVTDLVEEIEDGFPLMRLITALYGVPMAKHNKQCKMRAQKLDNCQSALAMVEAAKVKLANIKPINLVSRQLLFVLGTIWTIIHDYQIKGINVEELTAKEGLLLWCQKVTKGYKDVNVVNFTSSFADGLAFNAIIHKHRSDLLKFDALSKENKAANLQQAFDIAESKLDISKLLDVEDMVNNPDERSVITYVSEYFHYFSSRSQVDTAARRIAAAVAFTRSNDELKAEYEKGAQKLVDWANRKVAEFGDQLLGATSADAKKNLTEFRSYKRREKAKKSAKKVELESLFNQIRSKLFVAKRPDYTPPAHLSPQAVDQLWEKLGVAEKTRGDRLRENLLRLEQLELLLRRFAGKAKKFNLRTILVREEADELLAESRAATTVAAVHTAQNQFAHVTRDLEGLGHEFTALKALAEEIHKAGRKETDSSDLSLADVQTLHDTTRTHVNNALAALNQEVAKQQHNESLRANFGKLANEFWQWATKVKNAVVQPAQGDIAAALNAAHTVGKEIEAHANTYAELEKANQAVEESDIFINPHTEHTIEGLAMLWEQLRNLLHKKVQLLENQALAKKGSKLSAERIAEFQDTFKHFDKDQSGALGKIEFKAVLSSLGLRLSDPEFDKTWTDLDSGSKGNVNFEQFVSFMEKHTQDSDSPDQIKQAFKLIANDKVFVTEAELRSVFDADQAVYLTTVMPAAQGGYDYVKYVDSIYSR